MTSKLSMAARTALDTVQSLLHPLKPEDRSEVLAALCHGCSAFTEMYERVAELQRHNEQRHQEVWEARELLGARPDETLPMALRRHLVRQPSYVRNVGVSPECCCTFCGKERKEVRVLITGPRVYICDECITSCIEVLGDSGIDIKTLCRA